MPLAELIVHPRVQKDRYTGSPRKEFYGEGQLWFFYKRQGYKTFQFCPITNMTEARYRFPIPDDETVLGNVN